ncbi:NADH-quinone oxidoreductase subunit D [Sulfurimonas aquatica]|uniref:NADH-quinone oxidoreductase subunit D n=1 Tax=Sulfurimonas aquatica TaxID=2672570 RepID=A0A975AZE2_9BACT|nr:NADH-quinone oxidoreductase subunit D [Sulfurimonas aquatica]QSZ41402.1 NADH-quinone oxidoreductase subunit D [Sulfurimonas aquatica]
MTSNITTIEPNELLEVITNAKEKLGFTLLLDITAVDNLHKTHPSQSRFELIYILRHSAFKETLMYRVHVVDEKQGVETLSSLFSSANWAEREVYDQYGINFINHPNLKRLLNHHQFVGHPMRKDYEITKGQYCSSSEDLMDEMKPLLDSRGLDMKKDELMIVNLGPSHPASHGTIRTLAALDGEKIVAGVTEVGYLHRGFEKSCENHNYNQIIPYTDRLNYCSALMNNIAFAKTVEDMMDITLPDRGIFIRVILAELSRVIDHLVCLSAALLDMGAQTNYWYLFNPRNDAYDFLSKLTGARLTNSFMRIGGMTHDLYDGWQKDLADILTKVDKGVTESLKMITHNRIYNERVQDISPVSAEQAIEYGFTGPNLRASGVAYDLRFSNPYYYYDTFDFDMVVGSVGDTYDRLMVRFEEINESIKIINQAVERIPDGDFNIDDRRIIMPSKSCVYGGIEDMMNQFKLVIDGVKVKKGEYYGAFEAANGELGFYIQSDGSGTPYKVKVRPPSFYHIAAYPKIIESYQVADAIMTLGSLNIIAGEMDR